MILVYSLFKWSYIPYLCMRALAGLGLGVGVGLGAGLGVGLGNGLGR